LEGRAGRAEGQTTASDGYVAGVRPILAAQNRDERGLSGAVLAEKGADLASVNGEIDVVVRQAVTKRFADPSRFEYRIR